MSSFFRDIDSKEVMSKMIFLTILSLRLVRPDSDESPPHSGGFAEEKR
jgi:hypothetical protein